MEQAGNSRDPVLDSHCQMCEIYIPGKHPNRLYCSHCSKIAKKLNNLKYEIDKILDGRL